MSFDVTYQEEQLVALLKQRDVHAFDTVYDKYAPALYSVVLQIVRDEETGNNTVHKVFDVIWNNIESYDHTKERLFTWMLGIARRTAINETRSDAYPQVMKNMTQGGGSHDVTPQQVDNCGLKNLLKHLKDEHKELIDLCYYKDLTHDQIAQTLDIPKGTVKSKITLALSELRSKF